MPNETSQSQSSSPPRNTTQQNGSPSEDRGKVRKGQIDWVIGIAKATDFRKWSFKFTVGAKTYLSSDVYSDREERRYAWLMALIRAATLGGFEEMNNLIELYDSDGLRCEALLKKLEEAFMPVIEVERRKAVSAFMAYERGRKSLN